MNRSDEIRRLKEARETAFLKADAVLKSCPGGEGWNESKEKEFDRYQSEVEKLDRQIDSLEAQERKLARNLDAKRGKGNYISANHERWDEPRTGRNLLAQLARATKFGPGAAGLSEEIKAITSTSGSATLQDPTIMDELILELQAATQLTEAGVQFVNTENYRQIPKIEAYPAHVWQPAEGQEITLDSALTIGSIQWRLKDVAVRVRCSNQWLMDSSDRGTRLIQTAMEKAVNDAIFDAVINGSGSSGEPKGIRFFDNVQTYSIPGGPQAITDWEPIVQAAAMLAATNVPLDQTSLFVSPNGWKQLALLSSTVGDGQPLQRPPMLPTRIMNPTTHVLETFATNTETVMVMGDFSKVVVGMGPQMTLQLVEVRSAYLETEFLLHARVDIQSTHDNNFVVIDDILLVA